MKTKLGDIGGGECWRGLKQEQKFIRYNSVQNKNIYYVAHQGWMRKMVNKQIYLVDSFF